DVTAIERLVADLKAKIDAPPTDAKLDLAAHTTFPDTPGHFLDFDGGSVTIAEFVAHHWHDASPADGSKPAVQLAALTVDARVTAASLGKLDISTVLASFETHFGRGGDQAARATNIENASKKLDGLVLEPQQLVSFNGIVGERSEANGFKVAWEIFKGEMRPGVGGGTCQVASTLHAAAFFAGLDILERLPHSRPSAYIQMGLDSTVVYPSTDLKLKNPYPFSVVVHTLVTGNTLKVELLGKEKPVSVTFARETVAVLPYDRRIDEESFVKPGKAIKKQGGIRGYRIKRVRVLTALTAIGGTIGEARTEESFDFYPPTVEIYVVAPGTDPSELPVMPEDVVAALAKKKGEPPPEYAVTDAVAVACAGDCEGGTKPKLEVLTAAGVHAATGDQVAPMPKVLIKQ
ncbi:MAG: VanW family protein, partial [Kofleriaceae bacterium]